MSVSAYPLEWPEGWPRTANPGESNFSTTTSKAHKFVEAEVRRMGGKAMVISSNVPLKQDGTMRMDRDPVDAGVAVYFTRNEKQVVFASDRFDTIAENLQAIGKTIEALRGIERWGASEMLERAFKGFMQLETGARRAWWKVLDIPASASIEEIEGAFRKLARTLHPDVNKAADAVAQFQELTEARRRGLAIRGERL